MRILAGIQTETTMGANWNSKENKHTPIVKEGTNHKASQVKAMVEEVMNLSVSRIYEYLKDTPGDENTRR